MVDGVVLDCLVDVFIDKKIVVVYVLVVGIDFSLWDEIYIKIVEVIDD